MSRVSVVIPNFNGIQYLSDCLASLSLQNFQDFDVIVVDNASTEPGLMECMAKYPTVRLIQRADNGGFSVAVNEGICASSAEYVILLNNDITVNADFVGALADAMEEKKDAFSIQAKMVSMHNPEVMDDAGDFYTVLGWAVAKGKGKASSKYDKSCRIFSACAGAAIYRKSILDQIGLFDENHFAYLEDIDIGYRARLMGYNNYYEPKAVANHAGSATSGSRYNEFKVRLAARNSIYLIYKNQPLWQRILFFGWQFWGVVIKQLFFIKKKYGKVYHDAILEGVKLIGTKEAKEHKVKLDFKGHLRAFGIGFELFFACFRILFG